VEQPADAGHGQFAAARRLAPELERRQQHQMTAGTGDIDAAGQRRVAAFGDRDRQRTLAAQPFGEAVGERVVSSPNLPFGLA